MANITVCSLNIRGLRNKIKRKAIFHYLKKNLYDIICLQETYITDNDIDEWEREWGGRMFYSSVSTHSMGQAILVRKNFPFDVHCIFKSQRIIIAEVQLEEETVSVANIYGPNEKAQRKDFFNGIQRCFDDNTTGGNIVCGDFNCVAYLIMILTHYKR